MDFPQDKINNRDITIVLYKLSDINDFKDKNKNNHLNEYQCHYFAIVQQIKFNDETKMNIVYPIIYYNYKQDSNAISVDVKFENISNNASKLLNSAEKIFKNNVAKLEDIRLRSRFKAYKTSYYLTLYNNIHRHP